MVDSNPTKETQMTWKRIKGSGYDLRGTDYGVRTAYGETTDDTELGGESGRKEYAVVRRSTDENLAWYDYCDEAKRDAEKRAKADEDVSLSATMTDDGSADLQKRDPIRVGGIYSVKRPYQRSASVVRVERIHSVDEDTGFVIVFGSRIKVQSRKYRKSNRVEAEDFFAARRKVYSFKRVNAIETNNVQGHLIPDAYRKDDYR
jgi:hypothetical protein